ncbi:stage III sporulation protein AE [Anaerolentibacter hominis]|uniref:stage III sporulation protein AE n=1 Tax=Anaerolentibacter hominis TaxID=3079009 RepID=UPI0031B84AD0
MAGVYKKRKAQVQNMKRIWIWLLLLVLLCLVPSATAQANENGSTEAYDDVDYGPIQNVVDDILGKNNEFDFKEYVGQIISGEKKLSFMDLLEELRGSVRSEWKVRRTILVQLLSVTILAAVFSNFSTVFDKNQVSEMSFYISYLLIFSLLAGMFAIASGIVTNALANLLNFMKVLIPTYFIAMSFANGAVTSAFFYESTLLIIGAVELVLLHVIIPMIQVLFGLVLANNLSGQDRLSKFIDLIRTAISWLQKTMFAAVIGYHVIQGMLVPVAEYVKKSALLKVTSFIPGVGSGIASVAETVLGAGILLKNTIGMVGLFFIIFLVLVPVVKMGILTLICAFTNAVTQPISDRRMTRCMSGSETALKLLFSTMIMGAALFVITIAMITNATGIK